MTSLQVKKLYPDAKLPTRATMGSAGYDLYAYLDQPVTLEPGQTLMISLGITMIIPHGYVGLVFARSGLASKMGLAPANKTGVIDSDYRGEWFVPIHNHSQQERTIQPFDRICQVVVVPYLDYDLVEVDEVDETERGESGFGSSGL